MILWLAEKIHHTDGEKVASDQESLAERPLLGLTSGKAPLPLLLHGADTFNFVRFITRKYFTN